jgi:hypothetical protein
LDTEWESRQLSWVTQYFPIAEGEIPRMILEAIAYEANAFMEVDLLGFEIEERMRALGYESYAKHMAHQVVMLGRKMFQTLRECGAYVNGYLIYCVSEASEQLRGDIVLERLENHDLDMHVRADDEDQPLH